MKKLYIETYGCQMNVADSEVVASVMKMAGYDVCENEEEADAIFLNTCSVRENAENKIYNRLDTLHAEQRKGRELILGVLGCMAERVRNDLIQNHHANLVCGPDSYLNLPDMIAQCENGRNAMDIELSTLRPIETSFHSVLVVIVCQDSLVSCVVVTTSAIIVLYRSHVEGSAHAMWRVSLRKCRICMIRASRR